MDNFNGANEEYFKKFGYDIYAAMFLKEKLGDLGHYGGGDYKYAIMIIKEFDWISCCIGDLSYYPAELIDSLNYLFDIGRRNDINPNINKDIRYIAQFYKSDGTRFLPYNALENNKYTNPHGFLTEKDRINIRERVFNGEIIIIIIK